MICLVGFMGAGKSTALVELAAHGLPQRRRRLPIEERAGRSITQIRSRREAAFRDPERGSQRIEALADPRSTRWRSAVARWNGGDPGPWWSTATVVWLEISAESPGVRRNSKRPLARDESAFALFRGASTPLRLGFGRDPARCRPAVWDLAYEAACRA